MIAISSRLLLLFATAALIPAQTTYQPITGEGRLKWFAAGTFGPASLTGGVISAAWGTMLNTPHEYGTHWEGFGDRFGMRMTGVSTGNAMEAGMGALWGEDPRYFRAAGQPFGSRVRHIVKMAFMATGRNGEPMPAYARYIATAGNNFLSNTWRESSEADANHALARTGLGFAARMAGNAFAEFWPDVTGRLSKKRAGAGK